MGLTYKFIDFEKAHIREKKRIRKRRAKRNLCLKKSAEVGCMLMRGWKHSVVEDPKIDKSTPKKLLNVEIYFAKHILTKRNQPWRDIGIRWLVNTGELF